MNDKVEKRPKRGKGGCTPKNNPANCRYSVNFTAVEHARFLTLFEQSGVQSKARFIAARVFGEEFRVVKYDRSAMEYATKLSSFYAQFRSVGVNYNQVVKELHSHFSEKKTLALLYKLEKATVDLAEIGKRVLELSEEFKREWLQK
ncbi:conjugal transfer protein MobA [Bacteroides heparinolyticus]|uniref:conjugal transfer protein MobA n=2 Tax=Prevotella heparinolytica TaxID=28113 RepID=UPI00359F23F2